VTDEERPGLHLAQILMAVADPGTAPGLVRLASVLSANRLPSEVIALQVVAAPKGMALEEARGYILGMRESYEEALTRARACAEGLGLDLHTELRVEREPVHGILNLAGELPSLDLLLLAWQGPMSRQWLPRSLNQQIVSRTGVTVGVLRERELGAVRRVLVPIGWGPHARFGLRLAERLAHNGGAEVTAFRVLPATGEVDWEGERAAFLELVSAEAPGLRYGTELSLVRDASVVRAILAEVERGSYDLVVIGASDEGWLRNWLFGAIPDQVAERAPCSVLLVRCSSGMAEAITT
jgi:nucleotide-binding universal stress UspA family protein